MNFISYISSFVHCLCVYISIFLSYISCCTGVPCFSCMCLNKHFDSTPSHDVVTFSAVTSPTHMKLKPCWKIENKAYKPDSTSVLCNASSQVVELFFKGLQSSFHIAWYIMHTHLIHMRILCKTIILIVT